MTKRNQITHPGNLSGWLGLDIFGRNYTFDTVVVTDINLVCTLCNTSISGYYFFNLPRGGALACKPLAPFIDLQTARRALQAAHCSAHWLNSGLWLLQDVFAISSAMWHKLGFIDSLPQMKEDQGSALTFFYNDVQQMTTSCSDIA